MPVPDEPLDSNSITQYNKERAIIIVMVSVGGILIMPGKVADKKKVTSSTGFIACYKGKRIASARSFKALTAKPRVIALMGDKDLVIKHYTSGNMIAIY